MRRAILLLFALLSLTSGVARAQDALVGAYAQALRNFNPLLSLPQSAILAREVIAQADAQALDARLLVALIAVESRWHPEAVSPAGAIGLAQLMPATASGLGVSATDARDNIRGAAVHLRALLNRFSGVDRRTQYALALAAYNAGSGAVQKYGGIPPYPETRHYVSAVLLLWRRLAGDS